MIPRSGALACAALVGCATHVVPPPPPVIGVDRPGAAIPGDLDVALRIDLAGARRLFGPSFGGALALDIADPKKDRKMAELVSSAFARAETAWVALRPGFAPASTDNVLILRGDFGDFEPWGSETGFRAPVDLGGAIRLYERDAPERRSAPARIYARGDDWLVFVSTAEIDSAERTIERHIADEHVDPPDTGVLSLAARVRPLLPMLTPKYPAVAEALEDATVLEGSAVADDRGLSFDVSARFRNGHDTERARDWTKLLLSVLSHAKGPFGVLAQGANATAVGTSLVVRVRLDPKLFAGLLSCLGGTESC